VSSLDNSVYYKAQLSSPWVKATSGTCATSIRMLAGGNAVVAGCGSGDQQSLFSLAGPDALAVQVPSSASVGHFDMAANNATAVGICKGYICHRPASTFSWSAPGSWTLVVSKGEFVSVKPLADGSLLGATAGGLMWSLSDLSSGNWTYVSGGDGGIKDVEQFPNGTLLLLHANGQLYTKENVFSPLALVSSVTADPSLSISKISLCSEPRGSAVPSPAGSCRWPRQRPAASAQLPISACERVHAVRA
jgi:hypothetical protein